MSYVAEPYAQFVDDLLTALTGGTIRQRFVFLPEQQPFRLSAAGPVLPVTVRVFGQSGAAFRRFRSGIDYDLDREFSIVWRARPDGTRSADATWPGDGTAFFASFESAGPSGATPVLSDRNTGSVTRLLAESFAREFAVLSRQLQGVYDAGFLESAGGRDLESIVRLVGVERRGATHAAGAVVFSRSTPAPADIFIPAGSRLSTEQPPLVAFESTVDATLRRGELSVEIAIAALEPGPSGVVAANCIRVIHRPILGIDVVANSQPTRLAGTVEGDDELRARARRAHEGAGRATVGALVSALTMLPGVREKDLRVEEDHIAHPGVVHLSVALPDAPDDERRALAARALELIEETRPAGVRILHDLEIAEPAVAATPGPGVVPDEGDAPATLAASDAERELPVDVVAVVTPASASLSADDRGELAQRARAVIDAFFADAGLGEILVYNRLVARLIALDGVLDVTVAMNPQGDPAAPRHKNVFPLRPDQRLTTGRVTVEIGGQLVMLSLTVSLTLTGAGLVGDQALTRLAALDEIRNGLRAALQLFSGAEITPGALLALIPADETFRVTGLHYIADFVAAGVRVHQRDVTIPLTGLERPWIGSVTEAAEGESS